MRRELPTGLSPENLSRHHRHSLVVLYVVVVRFVKMMYLPVKNNKIKEMSHLNG